uniref:Uncharacterized protein n=1 Tax=Anguilla anguilla TaxID=7936 RepID=A0A0E9PST9_ANGAN
MNSGAPCEGSPTEENSGATDKLDETMMTGRMITLPVHRVTTSVVTEAAGNPMSDTRLRVWNMTSSHLK